MQVITFNDNITGHGKIISIGNLKVFPFPSITLKDKAKNFQTTYVNVNFNCNKISRENTYTNMPHWNVKPKNKTSTITTYIHLFCLIIQKANVQGCTSYFYLIN